MGSRIVGYPPFHKHTIFNIDRFVIEDALPRYRPSKCNKKFTVAIKIGINYKMPRAFKRIWVVIDLKYNSLSFPVAI